MSGGRGDGDPFADFRSGRVSVHPDDRLEVQTTHDVAQAQTAHPAPGQGQRPAPPQPPHLVPATGASLYQPVRPLRPAPHPEPPGPELSAPELSAPEQLAPEQLAPEQLAAVQPAPGSATPGTDAPPPRTRREVREAAAKGAQARDEQARLAGQPQVVPPRRPESPAQGWAAGSPSGDTPSQPVQRVDVQRFRPAGATAAPEVDDTGHIDTYEYHDDAHPDEQLHHDDAHPDDQLYYDDGYDGYHDGYDDDQGQAERAMAREGKRRRSRGPARVLLLLAVLAVVGLGSYAAWAGLQPAIQRVRDLFAPAEDFPGPGTGEAQVSVEQDDTGRDVGQRLYDAGVVASVDAFNDAAKANPDWTSVQVGDYRLAQQLPAADAVLALLDKDNKIVNRVTVNAGWQTDQVLQAVADATNTSYEQVVATALALPLPEGAALPPDVERAPSAIGDWEGWFLPYTYDLGLEPTAETVLTMMRDRTVTVLDGLGVAPADRRRVLTEASLVQAEGLPQDYGMVARVIENRITNGVPLQSGRAGPKLLQFDSTTNYATGIFDAQTTRGQRETPHAFNTYYAEGLPPGPINSPSLEAIQATINPTPGPWLFFVTVDLCTGETRFAETLAGHEDNRAAYQEWLRANPGPTPCA